MDNSNKENESKMEVEADVSNFSLNLWIYALLLL